MSAGAYLISELQRDGSESNIVRPPQRRPVSSLPLEEFSSSRMNADLEYFVPDIPRRHPFKSKSFFHKSMRYRDNQESHSVRRVDSMFDTSKGTLLRRWSRAGRSSASSSSHEENMESSLVSSSVDQNCMYSLHFSRSST